MDDYILVADSQWDKTPIEIVLIEQDFYDVTGEIVGYVRFESDTETNPHNATITIMIGPEFRGKGLGSAALAFAREYSATQRWFTVNTWVRCKPDESENAIRPHRPGGGVDPHDPIVQFLRNRDFRLDIVEKEWVLDLTDTELSTKLQKLLRDMNLDGYDIHVTSSLDEEEITDDYVEATNTFHKDAPSADTSETPTFTRQEMIDQANDFIASGWNAVEARLLDENGNIIGLTEVTFKNGGTQALQGATWIHKDHRGKRLSMALKIANTLALLNDYPDLLAITTEIAEENKALSLINEQLGFKQGLVRAEWTTFYNQRSWNSIPPVTLR